MNPPAPPVEPSQDGWDSRRHVHALAMLALTAVVLYLCLRLLGPFVAPLAWALALAVVLLPLQRRLEIVLRRPGLAALACVLLAMVAVLLPAAWIAVEASSQVGVAAQALRSELESGRWQEALAGRPRLASLAHWIERQVDLPGTAAAVSAWVTPKAAALLRGSLLQAITIALTFYLLFYLLRDRTQVLDGLRRLSPLGDAEMDRMFGAIGDTVHATVYGTLVMAAVQGTLGGLMFWWLGLPAPLLWGIVMGALALVPVLGAFVVWVPAALLLLLGGEPVKALILTGWGLVVVGGIDNLLYPVLVGKRMRMHTALTFIAIVGGIATFGAVGLVLGPLLFTLARQLLGTWRDQHAGMST